MAFSAAAGISTLFTIPRLFRAIKGGDGAPDIWETAGNVAINVGGKQWILLFRNQDIDVSLIFFWVWAIVLVKNSYLTFLDKNSLFLKMTKLFYQ